MEISSSVNIHDTQVHDIPPMILSEDDIIDPSNQIDELTESTHTDRSKLDERDNENKDSDSDDLSIHISSDTRGSESSNELFSLSTLDDSLTSYLIRTPGRVEISKNLNDNKEGDNFSPGELWRRDPIVPHMSNENSFAEGNGNFIETPEISSTPSSCSKSSIPSIKRKTIAKSLFPTDVTEQERREDVLLQTCANDDVDEVEFGIEGIDIDDKNDDDTDNVELKEDEKSKVEVLYTVGGKMCIQFGEEVIIDDRRELSSINQTDAEIQETNEEEISGEISVEISAAEISGETQMMHTSEQEETHHDDKIVVLVDETPEELKEKEWNIATNEIAKHQDENNPFSMDWITSNKNVTNALEEKTAWTFNSPIIKCDEKSEQKEWSFEINSPDEKNIEQGGKWKFKSPKVIGKKKKTKRRIDLKKAEILHNDDLWKMNIKEIKIKSDESIAIHKNNHGCCCSII